ncbi:hypothetical protein ACIBXA_20635 [Micromonospora echinaurantiaca]|uniref:hypothetical protein n=1 Tax=Micromonospora echinaurantiaca TaxID=47857 RepID=UPI0037B40FA2
MAVVTAGVHVKADTGLSFRSYPAEDRVTVTIGDAYGEVTVFLPRPEIDRLAGVLAEARESLSVSAVKAAA